MAKAYVTEYIGTNEGSPQGPGVTQTVSYTTTTQSNAFAATTTLIRINSDSTCSFEIGTNPTATANSARMSLGATEYIAVSPGHKIAFVTNT